MSLLRTAGMLSSLAFKIFLWLCQDLNNYFKNNYKSAPQSFPVFADNLLSSFDILLSINILLNYTVENIWLHNIFHICVKNIWGT